MASDCPSSRHLVTADNDGDRPPDDCPPCGAAPEASGETEPARDGELPYFHVGIAGWTSDRMVYRVYLAADALLFINLGVTTLDADVVGTQVGTQAGTMAGGLIGEAVGYLAKLEAQARIDEALKGLRRVNEAAVRLLVNEGGPHFVLETSEIRDVRIDPRSWWGLFAGRSRHAARLRFVHFSRGKMTLHLLHIDDVTTAVRELPRIFKDDLTINLSWNSL